MQAFRRACGSGSRTSVALCEQGFDFVGGGVVTENNASPVRSSTLFNFISSQQAVKEEGQDPDELGIALEATSKKMAKRCVKGSGSCLLPPKARCSENLLLLAGLVLPHRFCPRAGRGALVVPV